jgi:hypothetical protein
MMKVNIYIEKPDFDAFFVWVNRLNQGILSTPPVGHWTSSEGLKAPLQLSIDSGMYTLIADALHDLETIGKKYGEVELDFEPLSRSWELRTIKDVVRNSGRYDISANVIYTALITMSQIPGLSPAEAMIIAEREWVGSLQDQDNLDI